MAYGYLQRGRGGAIVEGRAARGQVRGCAGCIAGVLEDAKVQRLLVRLYAPRNGVACRDVDPADEVRLAARSASNNKLAGQAYLAVHFYVLHARHVACVLCVLCACRFASCVSLSCAIQVLTLELGAWGSDYRYGNERLRRNPWAAIDSMYASASRHDSSEVLYGRGLSGSCVVSFTIAGHENLNDGGSSEGGTADGRRTVKLSCTLSQLTKHAFPEVDVSQIIMCTSYGRIQVADSCRCPAWLPGLYVYSACLYAAVYEGWDHHNQNPVSFQPYAFPFVSHLQCTPELALRRKDVHRLQRLCRHRAQQNRKV